MYDQVAQDEAAADQQLLSAGLNDRNVEDFLGLIEQRIDDLIQVRYSIVLYYTIVYCSVPLLLLLLYMYILYV